MKRLCLTLGANLALIILLLGSMVSPAFAAGNQTTIGALELTATYECISVYSNFSDDDNANNFASFEWREAGGSWKQGMALTVDRREEVVSEDGTFTNYFAYQWRGSIIGLTADTTYEVRVTYTDPDGVSGDNPVTGSITTRSDAFPLGSGSTYYVAKDGNDSNDGGEGSPWVTIQHAADSVSAGDTVYIKEGTYAEEVTMSTSGESDNLITFLNYGSDVVTIDGENSRLCIIISNGVSHIRVSGLRLVNAHTVGTGGAFFINNNCWDIIVDNCHFEGMDTNAIKAGVDWGLELENNVGNITIQDNYISVTKSLSNSGHIIGFYNASGGGHVIRRNTIIWNTDWPSSGSYKDGIGGWNGGSPTGVFHRDTDIYDNYFEWIPDDAIECDGGDINVRVWNNEMKNCCNSLSSCCCVTGPLYYFRNVSWTISTEKGTAAETVKVGHAGKGWTYLYHNTFYVTTSTDCIKDTNPNFYNVVSRNNIYQSGRHVFEFKSGDGDGLDLDYDSVHTTDSSREVLYLNGNYGIEGMQDAFGWELNGMGVNAADEIVNADNGDLSLQSDSQLIDAGEILTGFNDDNSPWPYSGSGPDIGAYEYDSGPAVDGTPPYTSGHSPEDGTIAAPDTDIVVHILDDGAGVDQSTIVMNVEGVDVTADLVIIGNASDYTVTYDPPADFDYSQDVNVTVDATDLEGNAMDQEAYSFHISNESNNAPVLTAIGNRETDELVTLTFQVSATDDDGPLALAYSASGLPEGASFNPDTRTFTWTPTHNQGGTTYQNVQFQVTDGQDTTSENISITVNNVNQAPVSNAGSDQVVSLSSLVTLDGSGSSDPDGDGLTYLWTQTGGPEVTLSDATAVSPTFTSPDVVGACVFSLVVNDSTIDSNPDEVSITVDEWPYLPFRVDCAATEEYIDTSGHIWEIDQAYTSGYWGFSGDDQSVDRGSIAISGTDDDPIYQTERYGLSGYEFDLGDGTYQVALHFAETYLDGPGERIFDVQIEGVTVLDDLDIYSIAGGNTALIEIFDDVEVTDGQLNIDFIANTESPLINGIVITDAAVNQPPVASSDSYAVTPDTTLDVAAPGILANDYDNDDDAITAVLVSDVSHGTLTLGSDGSFTYAPETGYTGTDSFTYRASDGQEDSNTATVNLNIDSSNQAPVLGPIGDMSVTEGETLTFYIFAIDPDGDNLTYTADLSSLPAEASFDPISRLFSWSTVPGQAGTYSDVSFKASDGALDDSEIITITVYEEGSSNPFSGGGIGGAGGGTVFGITYLTDYITPSGYLVDDVIAPSADFAAELSLPQDTYCFSRVGSPLQYVSFQIAGSPPSPPEDASFVGPVYDINPNGATFDPSVLITIGYDGARVPDGVAAKNLVIAGCDDDTGQWQNLESTVNLETGTVTAAIGHSSFYAILAYTRPASFEVYDLAIPAEVEAGEPVDISIVVSNTGDLTGSYELALVLDGATVRTSVVTLDGGDSGTVTFTVTPETAGECHVSVGELAAVLSVLEPVQAEPEPEPADNPEGTVPGEVVPDDGAAAVASGISFDITPVYHDETGKLVSARLNYQVDAGAAADNSLVIRVLFDGELLEELLPLVLNQGDANAGSLTYIPALGWETGIYTFQADCSQGDGTVYDTAECDLEVTPELVAKVVNWKTLGAVIGATLVIIGLTVGLILYHRRDMLRDYIE